MKVYGQHWDLPEAPFVENPFQKFIKAVDDEVTENRRVKIPPAVNDHGRVEQTDDQTCKNYTPELQPVPDACTS